MSIPTISPGFSPSTPAPDAGFQNAIPRGDNGSPLEKFSWEVPNTGGVAVKTANYTLQASDCGKLIVANSASAITFTLPAAVPFGQWGVRIANIGSGALSVVPGGSLNLDGSGASVTVSPFKGLSVSTDGSNYFSERGLGGGAGSNMNYLGAWAAGAYSVGNVVLYQGNLYLCISPVSTATPAFVQSAAGDANNTVSVAFPSNVTAGDLLVISVAAASGVNTPTDTLGTTYSLALSQAGNPNVSIYYGVAAATGANTVTCAYTGGPTVLMDMVVSEFKGVVNALVNATAAANSAWASGIAYTVALTTTVAASLIYAAISVSGANTFTAASGFTITSQLSASNSIAGAYALESAIGTYNPGFTVAVGSGTSPLIAVAFDAGILNPSIDTTHWEPFPGTALINPMTAVGDLIVGGAVVGGVATPTRVAAGTSGYVWTSNGTGTAPSWQPGGGGGGGSPWLSITNPTLTTFAWRNQGSATVTNNSADIWLDAVTAISGNNIIGREISAGSAPFSVKAGMLPATWAVGYGGIYVTDGTKLVALLAGYNSSGAMAIAINEFNSVTSFNSQPFATQAVGWGPSPLFLKIYDDGTNLHFMWSPNGTNWVDTGYTQGRTSFLSSIAKFGFFVNSIGTTFPAKVDLISWATGTS